MSYNTVVLSGGGVKGIAMLGTLQYLKNINLLQDVKKYIGTSIGAILSFLMIIGIEPSKIIVTFVQKKHFRNLKSYSLVQAFNGKGLLKFERFQAILEDFILEKFEKIPTFEELYQTFPIKLYCVTFNYTKNQEEILSIDTHPEMLITDALRMTSNVPFIFDKFEYKGCYYYDGFLVNNFPIHLLDPNDKCVGISCFKSKWDSEGEKPKSWTVFWNLFLLPLNKLQDIKNSPYLQQCEIISIDLNQYSLFDFRLKNNMMLDLFSEGYCAAKNKIS